MNKIYWSIDLDFWKNTQERSSFSLSFFDDILRMNVPLCVVGTHHNMLRDIKRFDFDTIINTDFHSDLATYEYNHCMPPFNEGTWGNYIAHKRDKTFIWHYPNYLACCKQGMGYCQGTDFPNPFNGNTKLCGYKRVIKREQCKPLNKDGTIIAIGICISPNWSQTNHVIRFEQWMKDNHVRMVPDVQKAFDYTRKIFASH